MRLSPPKAPHLISKSQQSNGTPRETVLHLLEPTRLLPQSSPLPLNFQMS